MMNSPRSKRKVCFIITSFIHYSRSFLILEELKKRSDVELHIILGGVVLLERFASHSFDLRRILKEDKYENVHEVYFNVDGDGPVIKAKTVGLGMIEFSNIFHQIKPDIILVRGDRFEILSAVMTAVNMNIAVAHIEGGDLSGTVDESMRHAITKLAHFHFTTNPDAKQRVLRMGEDPAYTFNFGSPEIEILEHCEKNGLATEDLDFEKLGSGYPINLQSPYIMILFHPVTTELESLSQNTRHLLQAVHQSGKQAIWFWPNFDAGSEFISHELRSFNNRQKDHRIRFMRYLPPKQFLSLLAHTVCLIGNSSSGIKESSYLGVPVVNVGSRQNNRLHSENVTNCGNSLTEITRAIQAQLAAGRYPQSNLYSGQETAKRISEQLATKHLYIQKQFFE